MKCDHDGKQLDAQDIVEVEYGGTFRRARILSVQDTDQGNLEVELVLDAGEPYRSFITNAIDVHLVEKAVPDDKGEVIYSVHTFPDVPPTLPTAEEVAAVVAAVKEAEDKRDERFPLVSEEGTTLTKDDLAELKSVLNVGSVGGDGVDD